MDNRERKILVVEDDPDIREIMVIILEMEGYTVNSLADGKKVHETIQREVPDVLLLDVMLGDSNGLEICEELKQDPATCSIPIMIVSATHGYGRAGGYTCLADDFLNKPFNVAELLNKVGKLAA